MNRKIIKYFCFIILFNTGTLACRKDNPIVKSDCYNFYDKPQGITWITSVGQQYKHPTFNPNNANEFVYYNTNFATNTNTLIKYNILTGVKTVLANDVKLISQPKWSNKGWIAFDNSLDYQIWIVKDNGDSLSQFTTNTTNLYPVWDNTGLNLYWQYSPVLANPYYFFKKNLNNSMIDTVLRNDDANNGYAGFSDISNNNILLTNTYINNQSYLAYTDISSINFNSLFNIYQTFTTDYIRGLTWSNDSETAYFTVVGGVKRGLYKLNVNTGNYAKLIEFCDSKCYGSISCSSNGEFIIGERIDSYIQKNSEGKPTGGTVENSSIYLINLVTMEELKIKLK